MSPKKLIAVRASAQLIQQIDALVRKTGASKTELISLAVDRMYQQEIQSPATSTAKPALYTVGNQT